MLFTAAAMPPCPPPPPLPPNLTFRRTPFFYPEICADPQPSPPPPVAFPCDSLLQHPVVAEEWSGGDSRGRCGVAAARVSVNLLVVGVGVCVGW